ncbi:exodeoxyribonuclease VII large subunit [Veronia nyctiphanis]|uniref:Exodeoxyribonuclease 7 large subunit n=1 Tax=Veronia nyctiphanis TaxID=1278244 RepID=A0A4Q0YPY2_9GAMM|nr:exodeoxyribonuclease VII large subunit [Veronia nyctiphanis]RXJ73127.1 exodeoxyribonuclease VII large subunit [Veronia nyctiphanis]
MNTDSNSRIYTVSHLNAEVRRVLENEMGIVWLVGEISNLTVPTSGHWYFTLKDSQAQVKCAMFRGNNRRVTFKPANGNQVLVRARLSLYEPRGDYQLIIESMQPEGEGLLKQMFEKLKMQLSAEGLFASSQKRTLPEQPKRVGIITSKTGAALHDILNVLKRRDPSLPVVIYPTLVQGDGAAIEIAQAIGRANSRDECDVLIVGRGGGSMEDLWCFNEEIVARTIAASQIPIVSAVGHEVDVTIADFVADVRAPTPSAAAELVSRDTSLRQQQIQQRIASLGNQIERFLDGQARSLTRLFHVLALQDPKKQIERQQQQIDALSLRMNIAMQSKVQRVSQTLDNLQQQLQRHSPIHGIQRQQRELIFFQQRLKDAMEKNLTAHRHAIQLKMETLDAVSPLATLTRGFSVTQSENSKVIRSVSEVSEGQTVVSVLPDGKFKSKVL